MSAQSALGRSYLGGWHCLPWPRFPGKAVPPLHVTFRVLHAGAQSPIFMHPWEHQCGKPGVWSQQRLLIFCHWTRDSLGRGSAWGLAV